MNHLFSNFQYNRKDYKKSFNQWFEFIREELNHSIWNKYTKYFEKHYQLSSSQIEQYIKRYLINSYDFSSSNQIVTLKNKNLFFSFLKYLGSLFYFYLYSRNLNPVSTKYHLLIDDVQDLKLEGEYFKKFLEITDLNIAFITINKHEFQKYPEFLGKKVYCFPFYRGYLRKTCFKVLMKELVFGIPFNFILSWKNHIDFFKISGSILNQYLYYFTVFSSVKADICLSWRDYNSFSIKKDLFKQFGGIAVSAVQRSRHGNTPVASFIDLDIYFPMGDFFTDLIQRLDGSIQYSLAIGSLACESRYHSQENMTYDYDIIYFDSALVPGLNLYQQYIEDHMDTYHWLIRFSKNHPYLKIGLKQNDGYPLSKEISQLVAQSGIKIISNVDSYQLASTANICTTFHSTIGFEVFGEGKKTLFCNPGGRNPYIPDHSHFHHFTATCEEQFHKMSLELLKMGHSEFVSYHKTFNYYCVSSQKASVIMNDCFQQLITEDLKLGQSVLSVVESISPTHTHL
jgi:hypothetical protein